MRAMLVISLFSLLVGASASPCQMGVSNPEVDTGPESDPRFYVDVDPSGVDGPILSLWVYQESNGAPGLQRDDEVVDDTCGGAFPGDTPVF